MVGESRSEGAEVLNAVLSCPGSVSEAERSGIGSSMNTWTAPSCPPTNWTTLWRARGGRLQLQAYAAEGKRRFPNAVPIYFELAHGHPVFVGRARLAGDSSVEQKVSMKGLKAKPRRALLNSYHDVLASPC